MTDANSCLDPDQRCLSVIMPAYNELATIAEVVSLVLGLTMLKELIIVDDHSTDGTFEIAQRLAVDDSRILVIRNQANLGKTDSVKIGIAASSGSVVVIQDADLEYAPTDIRGLVEPILSGDADIAYGSRFSPGADLDLPYYSNYIANRVITFLSNLLSGLDLADVQTCYVAMRGDIARSMIITAKRFGFEVEAAAKIAKLNVRIHQIPISYHARTYANGKKVRWTDGFTAIWYILKYNLLIDRERSFERCEELTSKF